MAGCCIWRLGQQLWYVRSALAAGEACRRPCQPAAAAYPHPASQALGERLSGRETGSVREGQSEARLTIWRAPLTKRPAPLAPHGSGTTACSRLAPVRTSDATSASRTYVICGFVPVLGRTVAEREPRVHGHVIFWLQTPLYGSWSYKMESNSYFWGYHR